MIRPRNEGGLVRPYVVTEGRSQPTRNTLDVVTLVMATREPPTSVLNPEKRRMLALCRAGTLSVAEVAGHLMLPVSVAKVLLADLIDTGHVITRPPAPTAERGSAALLQEVLDGLRALA
ncbi:uncharacterized protein DUF742 [Nonomuraea fuscirosea]|uniref:Uncharacterized protein DUF742 n=1 Tax=Nonomuraea fuscirosea TaxID=1291556 RepID=A0A2T0LSZ9_9ACTN|nr:DUF742 domain-containing protein [Nonomuraea fuscirosea]PRX46788.1 uncharacterized protein DUF742 [Nonomuraea fuscirosea]